MTPAAEGATRQACDQNEGARRRQMTLKEEGEINNKRAAGDAISGGGYESGRRPKEGGEAEGR